MLMELISALARAHDIAILFTEHDMNAVFKHADRIIVLVQGEIIAAASRNGAVTPRFNRPHDPRAKVLRMLASSHRPLPSFAPEPLRVEGNTQRKSFLPRGA